MDVVQFVTKATDLYNLAPTFLNWLFGIICALIAFLIGGAFWLAKALGDSKSDGLKAQNDALSAQVALAKDRADTAQKATDVLKVEVEELRGKVAMNAPNAELALATRTVEEKLRTLVSANTAVQGSLTILGRGAHGTVFKLTAPSE